VLCCVVLCCVVLCCVVLCCVVLCCVVLCYVMLCYVMLCYVMFYKKPKEQVGRIQKILARKIDIFKFSHSCSSSFHYSCM